MGFLINNMKISELKLGDRATINSKFEGHTDYKFTGTVEKNKSSQLWLTNGNDEGYLVNSRYDYIWDVKLTK